MSFIRSVIHMLWMGITVIPYTLLILIVRVFGGSPALRWKIARAWLKLSVDSAGWFCGVKYRFGEIGRASCRERV